MTAMKGRSIGWVGSLNRVPLPEVFKKVALEERSGDLQIICGHTIKTVYFDRGFIVFAASNLKRDRLGENMIGRGRISRHEFALATMLMKNSHRRFGQALVQAGLMSEEELGRHVALQVNRIVLSLFKVVDGIYSFDERPSIIPVQLMVSLSIYRILLDGIRRMANHEVIRSGLPTMKTRLGVSERPPFTLNVKKLTQIEQDVLRAAGKGVSIGSIVRQLPQDREQVLKACYALWSAGLLEPKGTTAPTRPLKVQEETGAFVLSEIQQKFAQIRATNIRQEILMEFDRLDRIADSALLKVGGQANESEIQKAYEQQKDEWEKKRRLVEDERSMVTKLDEIQNRLQSAYDRMIAERERQKIAPPPKVEDRPTPAPPASTTTAGVIEPMPQKLPTALPPLDDELIEEVEIETGTNPAAPPPDVASPSETQPAFAGVPSKASPSATLPESATAPQYDEAQRRTRIQQLFRDVKLHFQVRDWEGAVSLLYELVKLAPHDSSYRGMLARAMARHPVMRKDAERHFIKALRLDPQSADLHFSLGLYYKSFGMKSRAETEFRTTLRIQPNHEGARKHLVGDRRRKDPLRDMFRKIFG